jgi:FkbM family methyltransferase
VRKYISDLIKKIFNAGGFDIIRIASSPTQTLLGLKNLTIRTIIDVGANAGQFARMVQKIFPEANIYCFEPLPAPFGEISRWAKNQQDKIKVFNLSLGDAEGNAEMSYHLKHSPSSSFLKTTELCEALYPLTKNQSSIIVKQTTLDKIMAGFPKPPSPEILIKIDVQGYEINVIRGGLETLSKSKACIIEINLYELYKSQPSFKELFLLLDEIGYKYLGNLNQTYAEDGHVISMDAFFEKESKYYG